MKVLVLLPYIYDTSPGARFRIEQWARYMEREGVEFDFASFEDGALHRAIYQQGRYLEKVARMSLGFGRRLMSLSRVRKYDLVFLHREASIIGPAVLERLLARLGVPVVFDFDDAIWTPYVSPVNRHLSYLKFFGKTPVICRLSTHITVGNEYLAEFARRYNPNVSVVPTTIDTETYLPSPLEGDDRPPTIGWTGSHSTVQHLDTLRGALAKLRGRQPYRLQVVGTPAYALDGVEVDARPWRAESEVQDLRGIDVGVMPLPDDDYAKGKCGLKMLQYMALGIPPVASPVGVNSEIVEDGVDGFLAANEGDWVEKLAALLSDPELRTRIGRAGRETVERRYSAEVWAPRVHELFKAVASGRRRDEPAAPTVTTTRP